MRQPVSDVAHALEDDVDPKGSTHGSHHQGHREAGAEEEEPEGLQQDVQWANSAPASVSKGAWAATGLGWSSVQVWEWGAS